VNLEEYRTLFAVTTVGLMLTAAFPTLSLVVPFPRSAERFSELWVLGPNRMAEDYPFNVRLGEEYRVFVGVGNHMGSSSYYRVCVKFRNQSQPLPDASNSTPSPLPPLFEFRFLITDGGSREAPLTFEFLEVSHMEDSCLVRRISINDVVFSVDSPSRWDPENKGFYYQLFFELWLYDLTSRSFQFHDRFVGIWLNMTGQF